MRLYRAENQSKLYNAFEWFLKRDVPSLIRQHPSVCNAVIKYGFYYENDSPRNNASYSIASQPLGQLNFALLWNTAPQVVVIDLPRGGPLAELVQVGLIRIHRGLVDRWETLHAQRHIYGLKDVPHFTYVERVMYLVVIHELVHHLQHLSSPRKIPAPKPGHFRESFHQEAFGKLWSEKDLMLLDQHLRAAGVP